MKASLYIVVEGNETDLQAIQKQLSQWIPSISFSPIREQESLNDCLEFHATFEIQEEQVRPLLDRLDNDWDGEEDDCICYGFNTKPFDPHIYYMRFDYEKKRNLRA